MNPRFIRTASDRNGARNEYIKNLQLETSNNLLNYNANQQFKATGQLPPSVTALLDTRSITEKYADTQKARVAVLSGLREITDGANANVIVSQINSKDMIPLLNNLPQIIAEIKPKWSLGIPAPAFIGYWDSYKQAIALTNGVSTLPIIQSNQLLTNIQGLLQNIQATLATKQDYALLKSVFALLPRTEEVEQARRMIETAEEDAQTIYSLATEMSRDITKEKDPIEVEQKIQSLYSAVENSPPRSVVQNLTQQAQIISQLGNSPQEANQIAGQVRDQFQMGIQMPMSREEAEEIGLSPSQRNLINGTPRGEEEYVGGSPSSMSDITTETFKNTPAKNLPPYFKRVTNIAEFMSRDWDEQYTIIKILIGRGGIPKADINFGEVKNISGLRKKNWKTTNLPELVENYYSQKSALGGAEESKKEEGKAGGGKKARPTYLPPPAFTGGEEPLEPTAEQIAEGGKESGTGIKKKRRIQGKGINAHRTHALTTNLTSGGNYYQKPKIDTSHKVEKVPSYIEFGKHVLHQHNLQGGILQIRRRSGTIINDLPRQAVGGKLKKVLITLTGTGSPSFEDINELNDSEKNLLNKIVKTCKIDQRLLVPTPNKNKEEQDFNRLQILSGEITAGNNNPQIVKELKTILLRLKNVGRIPKKHAHEIMEDLLSLGY
jgi:hypothetical protein